MIEHINCQVQSIEHVTANVIQNFVIDDLSVPSMIIDHSHSTATSHMIKPLIVRSVESHTLLKM